MQTKELIEKLVVECGCRLHSKIGSAPADIDIYIMPDNISKVSTLVEAEGFVLTNKSLYQKVYRRFESGQLFIVDLVSNFNVYAQHTAAWSLSNAGSERMGQSKSLHRSFKYLCFNRRDKVDFVEANYDELAVFVKDKNNFEWISPHVVDAASGSAQDFFLAMKKPYQLSLFLPRFFEHNIVGWFKDRWKMLGAGYSIAFIGPDGSGKSFFIDKFRPAGVTRTVYMGDWFFMCQKFYNMLLRIPSPFNRFMHVFYVVENYLRLLRVFWLRFLGRVVLIDRFPGTNRSLVNDGSLYRINEIIFGIFPKPDLIALMYAPPEVVHKRKQELSVKEIGKIQEQLKKLIANTKHIILDTEQIDVSLNKLLTLVYGRTEKLKGEVK